MLNVEDSPIVFQTKVVCNAEKAIETKPQNDMYTFNQKITNYNEDITINENIDSSCERQSTKDIQQNIIVTSSITSPKPKKISVVDINIEPSNETIIISSNEINENSVKKRDSIDQEDISKQINEIIDQAVEINESKLNANNENIKNVPVEEYNEINNNNVCKIEAESPVWNYKLPDPPVLDGGKTFISMPNNEDDSESSEIPIKPVLNETHTFDFQEYHSDQSLSNSTTNTMETPSTGPESLITSDIEDGYKGNDAEKNRRIEMNREEFIESQFGFLSEHLDSKTNEDDADDEKLFKKSDVISSTMITNKINDTYTTLSPTNEKSEVISELTYLINGNRLDTFIKPNTEKNGSIDVSKRSSLANFQISAYTNGNHENVKTKTISPKSSSHNDRGDTTQTPVSKRFSLTNGLGVVNNEENNKDDVSPKQVNRSMSFHSTFSMDRDENSENQNKSGKLSLAPRSTSYVSLIGMQKAENRNGPLSLASNLNDSRQKSNSELSIADAPSLQSIEIMKSILSSSLALNVERKSTSKEKQSTPTEIKAENENKKQSIDVQNEKQNIVDGVKLRSANEKKTWKYQGPPAVNLSTWGERPKSQVYIKSDNDYIFGGGSKMAALQKRFSGINEDSDSNRMHNNRHSNGFKSNAPEQQCENDSCKLPIVRGVEYKKNVLLNGKNVMKTELNDATDSTDQMIRPSYEISRIVSDKPFSEKLAASYTTLTLSRFPNALHRPESNAPKPTNGKFGVAHRIHSFNGHNENESNGDIVNGNGIQKTNDEKSGKRSEAFVKKEKTTEVEKPLFSQFTLRKTGLKEKILDDNTKSVTKSIINTEQCNGTTNEPKVKLNPIPTAPKPPPILKKPKTLRSVSANAIPNTVDTHDQLLDSIRNFKRDTLKRNRVV